MKICREQIISRAFTAPSVMLSELGRLGKGTAVWASAGPSSTRQKWHLHSWGGMAWKNLSYVAWKQTASLANNWILLPASLWETLLIFPSDFVTNLNCFNWLAYHYPVSSFNHFSIPMSVISNKADRICIFTIPSPPFS